MVRTEISLFLVNQPGELGKLATLLAEAEINIDALTIQDASSYVRELFKNRGKSLKRIASAASIMPVIAVELDNKPGELARISAKLGEEGININYVYGSVSGPDAKCLFVFCPEDIDHAAKVFQKPEGK
ncbi:MAG: ACT domain-containing protein [Desulfosarcinaceae bacterium]